MRAHSAKGPGGGGSRWPRGALVLLVAAGTVVGPLAGAATAAPPFDSDAAAATRPGAYGQGTTGVGAGILIGPRFGPDPSGAEAGARTRHRHRRSGGDGPGEPSGSSWTVGRPAGVPVPGTFAGRTTGSERDSVGETLSETVDSGVNEGSSWT